MGWITAYDIGKERIDDKLLGMFILTSGLNAGLIGLDHWLIPDIRNLLQ